MRIIYNEDLNKRIIPYVDKLIKNKKKLDKETAVLFDVFIQYLDMDTRYGTYGEQLEPCITEIIREESIRNVAHLFDGKLNKLLLYLLGTNMRGCLILTRKSRPAARILVGIHDVHNVRLTRPCISTM